MNSHYVKNKKCPSELNHTQQLVWKVIQAESLMDVESIHNEIRIYCINNKIDPPAYIAVIQAVVELEEMEFISELTGPEIKDMLSRGRADYSSMGL